MVSETYWDTAPEVPLKILQVEWKIYSIGDDQHCIDHSKTSDHSDHSVHHWEGSDDYSCYPYRKDFEDQASGTVGRGCWRRFVLKDFILDSDRLVLAKLVLAQTSVGQSLHASQLQLFIHAIIRALEFKGQAILYRYQ